MQETCRSHHPDPPARTVGAPHQISTKTNAISMNRDPIDYPKKFFSRMQCIIYLIMNKVFIFLQFLYSQKHTHIPYTTRNTTNTHLEKEHTLHTFRDQEKYPTHQSSQTNHKPTANTTHTATPQQWPTKTTNNKPLHKQQHHINTYLTHHKLYTTKQHTHNITIIITLIIINWLSSILINQQAHFPISPIIYITINTILQLDPLSLNMNHILH